MTLHSPSSPPAHVRPVALSVNKSGSRLIGAPSGSVTSLHVADAGLVESSKTTRTVCVLACARSEPSGSTPSVGSPAIVASPPLAA
jgi:hypothetical protein